MKESPSRGQDSARIVAITGASGGIGSALARHFAGLGDTVVLSDVDHERVEALVSELGASGRSVFGMAVDVRDAEAVKAWADATGEQHGRVDVLINNAGITTWRRFDEQSTSEIDRLMDINVRGVMYGCRAFLPWLRRAQRGRIVNVSSMIALMGGPMQVNYTASKWAIRGFSQALRMELAGEVGVTTVMPGTVATSLLAHAAAGEESQRGKEEVTTLASLMQRYGTSPEYVARRIARAVKVGRGEVRIGWDCHLVAFVQRFLPGLLPLFIRAAFRFSPSAKALSAEVEP